MMKVNTVKMMKEKNGKEPGSLVSQNSQANAKNCVPLDFLLFEKNKFYLFKSFLGILPPCSQILI